MSQVVEGTEDNLTTTRRALTAGNTATSLKPMDVAEAAYYIQHPDEAPGAEQEAPAADAQEAAVPDAETHTAPPEADPLDVEVTDENAAFVGQFVTRKEFNHLAERVNELLFRIEDLEGRIERHNATAQHKIK